MTLSVFLGLVPNLKVINPSLFVVLNLCHDQCKCEYAVFDWRLQTIPEQYLISRL